MNNKRPYGKALGVTVQRKPFRAFPQNTTVNTTPMVLYRTPSQFKSLTNPPQGRIWPEKKAITLFGSLGQTASSTWSELDFLNPCLSGANNDQRIGRKIQLKSVLFRWHEASTPTTSGFPLRILMVYDKAPEQALPAINEIVSGNSFNVPNFLSNSDRFVTLADEIIPPINLNIVRAGVIYKKLNLPSVFIGATGGIDDITTGAIFVACITNGGAVGSGIGYASRVRYTDV